MAGIAKRRSSLSDYNMDAHDTTSASLRQWPSRSMQILWGLLAVLLVHAPLHVHEEPQRFRNEPRSWISALLVFENFVGSVARSLARPNRGLGFIAIHSRWRQKSLRQSCFASVQCCAMEFPRFLDSVWEGGKPSVIERIAHRAHGHRARRTVPKPVDSRSSSCQLSSSALLLGKGRESKQGVPGLGLTTLTKTLESRMLGPRD